MTYQSLQPVRGYDAVVRVSTALVKLRAREIRGENLAVEVSKLWGPDLLSGLVRFQISGPVLLTPASQRQQGQADFACRIALAQVQRDELLVCSEDGRLALDLDIHLSPWQGQLTPVF